MVSLRSLLIIMSPLDRYTRLKFHYNHHDDDDEGPPWDILTED